HRSLLTQATSPRGTSEATRREKRHSLIAGLQAAVPMAAFVLLVCIQLNARAASTPLPPQMQSWFSGEDELNHHIWHQVRTLSNGGNYTPARVGDGFSLRHLLFEDRVAYQRAIEEVYWRHRIWPKERPDPKPSLDAVMSQAQLEAKVADYLRKSQALEDYFQRPITVEQLQAEMDRMAQHTRHPEVLRELIQALGNDPFVIAECLARPALAERLLRSWYAYDDRIHGNLKRRATADLLTSPIVAQMKQLSGRYSEIDLVRSDTVYAETEHRTEHGVKL